MSLNPKTVTLYVDDCALALLHEKPATVDRSRYRIATLQASSRACVFVLSTVSALGPEQWRVHRRCTAMKDKPGRQGRIR